MKWEGVLFAVIWTAIAAFAMMGMMVMIFSLVENAIARMPVMISGVPLRPE